MRAWMMLLAALGLLQRALPQAQADGQSVPTYEEEPDADPEQEGGSDELEPEPDQERSSETRDKPEATREHQRPWSSAHRSRYNKEFGDYTPFLLCLQRKQAQLKQTQQKGSHKGLAKFKTHANSWVEHMKSVEAEVVKTRCQPREVCIQVSAEQPMSTNTFYVPKCISLHRCGGCCSGESRSCISTSQEYISKTLIELTIPPLREPMPVSILFVNHTVCECSSSLNPRRSINRRASNDLHTTNVKMVRLSNWSTAPILKTSASRCSKVQASCSNGLSWDSIRCRCVEDQKMLELRGNSESADVCGVHRVFSEDSCSCVCKNGLNSSSCGHHQVFNKDSCHCACKNELDGLSCGPHQVFSEDSCRCVCKNSMDDLNCGPHRGFSEDSCHCVCKNGINSLICGPHRLLEDSTCACVCPEPALGNSCKPDWDWDKEKCRCVCRKSCPKHTSLNEPTCQCECQDQGAGCTSRGMMFNPHSCSCYRLSCPRSWPQCQNYYYYNNSAMAYQTT